MIPQREQFPEFTIASQPSRTYALVWERNVIQGYADEREALMQAIYLILNTERYQYVIYSWNYGIELMDLIGREKSYVLPELERRISEALLQDDRITAVNQFQFAIEKKKYTVTFVVEHIYGSFDVVQEVNL